MAVLIILLILFLFIYLFRGEISRYIMRKLFMHVSKKMGMNGSPFDEQKSKSNPNNQRNSTGPKNKIELDEIDKRSLEMDKGDYVDFEETKD